MKKTKTIHLLKTFKICQLQHVNQYVITSDNYFIFQSYDSLIAIYDRTNKVLTVGIDWDYSNTTRKHLYLFLQDYCYNTWCLIKDKPNKREAIQNLIDNNKLNYDVELV